MSMLSIPKRIADELSVQEKQVVAAIELLDSGSTVPFISRYRKEVTGGLDDGQLRLLEERLGYLRELEDRRQVIIKSIEDQGKMTTDLLKAVTMAETKTRLEDLYLPYKPKRRTKGQIAIEAGLEPLADLLLSEPQTDPELAAAGYLNTNEDFKGAFSETKGVLEGARAILMERFSEDPELVGKLRSVLQSEGKLVSKVVAGKEKEGAKFQDYFDNADSYGKIPSHRVLAMLRGRQEGFLQLSLDLDVEDGQRHPCEAVIAGHLGIEHHDRPADNWLADVVRWTWRVKLHLRLETELMAELRQQADLEAIQVFANNLKDLLLAAPAGQKATMGLDPGLRTGVKIAVIDNTGQYVDQATIYPHAPRNQWDESIAVLAKLAQKHQVTYLAIGNGTASRETDRLASDLMKRHPGLGLQKVMVSEAGASVYSASETAAREFPDLDVTIRGAVSIARRLQDPLAELVKIEPKSIGVGQYQHDVNQSRLAKKLDDVVEDCVNSVGVEVNTASAALLKQVAGLNQTIAENIVAYRNREGRFNSREALKKVPRLGDRTFEQAAGFLRIHAGDNPLDASAVHPESYGIVNRIAVKTNTDISSLIGNRSQLSALNATDFVDENTGLPTVLDIIAELEKPGRDPRPAFKTATFRDGIEKLSDLKADMVLEGTVTNVTNFGAFIDIGVHQDGLVHISALADKFVKDPHEVVKAGDVVKVKVVDVDQNRKRIALTMRLQDKAPEAADSPRMNKAQKHGKPTSRKRSTEKRQRQKPAASGNNAFANAFARAKEKA